jgi:hypothetical protein
VTCLLLSVAARGQFSSLGAHEKRWVLFHPVAAIKVRHINSRCVSLYTQPQVRSQLDTFVSGGRLDAYRHVFFMAAFAQKVRVKKLRKLGQAHEKTNYRQFLKQKLEEGEKPDSLSSVMDLLNNELGLKIGCNYRELPLPELSSLVIKRINAGEARMFRRDSKGRYVDCSGVLIDQARYSRQWHVPKCLVDTSEGHSP